MIENNSFPLVNNIQLKNTTIPYFYKNNLISNQCTKKNNDKK